MTASSNISPAFTKKNEDNFVKIEFEVHNLLTSIAVLWFCSGSGLYSGGLTWSIVLRCDDHTGIFTCDGCARDPYFYVPAETQSCEPM